MSKTNTDTGKHTTESQSISPYWLVLAVVLAGMLFYMGYSVTDSTQVTEVSFTGLYFSDADELNKLLPEVNGAHVDSLNYLALIEQVEKAPYVKKASAVLGYNGKLEFQIEERTPIGLLAGKKQRYYVDADGVVVPVILPKAVKAPLVYGFPSVSAGDTLRENAFEMANEFLLSLKNDHLLSATISEISVDEEAGITAYTHERAIPLQFGKTGYERKLKVWRTFYSNVVVDKGLQQFKTIDFRFNGQIVTRQRANM